MSKNKMSLKKISFRKILKKHRVMIKARKNKGHQIKNKITKKT